VKKRPVFIVPLRD